MWLKTTVEEYNEIFQNDIFKRFEEVVGKCVEYADIQTVGWSIEVTCTYLEMLT